MNRLIQLVCLFALSPLGFADDVDEFNRLESIMRQQVICLDLVEGSVGVGQQQPATKKFFSALVSNIRSYVDLGTKMGMQDLIAIRQYVGSDDVLVGVFLGGMLSDDADLQREKDELREGRSTTEIHQALWKQHGCDAAYTSLPPNSQS